MEDKITEILQLVRDNNRMLREIILYLSNEAKNADRENYNDFIRNIAADLVGTAITGRN